MPRKLTLEECKIILKRYWKTENAQDVIRDWNHYFNTDPPTRLAIYKLRDKFDDTGSVADAYYAGRRGPIEFPPRSPDITPMDFFVWGVIKDSVYSRKPRSVEDLQQFVIDAFTNLDHDLCTKVCPSVVSRCRECIGAEGLRFEYLS